jgi:hypothetical protein
VQTYQPPKPQPAAPPVQHRAPPPYRPEPQTFQPATGSSRFSGLLANLGALAIWAGVFIFIGVVIASAYWYRYEIIRTWRPAATIYAMLGLDVNVRGLVFTITNEEVPLVQNDVVIRGQIVNISAEEQPIPKVHGLLLDENKKPVHQWTFPVEAQTVAPGGKVSFLTRVQDPPPTARSVELRFAPLDE